MRERGLAHSRVANRLTRLSRHAPPMSLSRKPAEKLPRRVAKILVRILAGICGVRQSSREQLRSIPRPKRILVINPAHLGDTLLAGSLIPILQSAYPGVEIGFAVGSWCEVLIRDMSGIAFLHVIDHWWLNRSGQSRFRKLIRYFRTRSAALREIRRLHYDICFCPYPYYAADMVFFAWQAGIADRIAFSRSIFAPFATAVARIPASPFVHQGRVYAEILQPLGIPEEHIRKRKTALAPGSPDSEKQVCELLSVPDLIQASYFIVHIGSGNPCKELSPAFWKTVASELSRTSTVLFTGTGSREDALIAEVTRGLDRCINACGKLSWSGFVAAVRGCRALFGVDTMAGHVAAAVGTPCVVVYSGIGGVAQWRPDSDNCIVLTHHVPCAPCHLPQGCGEMTCLRTVTPADVLFVNDTYFSDNPSSRHEQKVPEPLYASVKHAEELVPGRGAPLR